MQSTQYCARSRGRLIYYNLIYIICTTHIIGKIYYDIYTLHTTYNAFMCNIIIILTINSTNIQ